MRNRRVQLLFRASSYVTDATVLAVVFYGAYLLRFDFQVPPSEVRSLWLQLPYVLLFQFVALMACGVYRFVWRYIGLADTQAFLRAGLFSAVPLVLLRFALPAGVAEWRVPLSVIIMDTVLGFGALLALRVVRRINYEHAERQKRAKKIGTAVRQPILLVGAGRLGSMVSEEIRNRGDAGLRVVGFVDDEPSRKGTSIQGVRVLGATRDIPRLVRARGIDHVVITIRKASSGAIRRIIDVCEQTPVRVRIIPAFYELIDGSLALNRLRDLQIEDLLWREVVELDQEALHGLLSGRRVLVTGGGGSIGAELCEQVARFDPAVLIVLDRAEFALFEVDRRLQRLHPELERVPIVADICDRNGLERIFAEYAPEIVLHAAAHKHVPLMEFNAAEAVKNNVLGTHLVAEIAGEKGAGTFVLISTDKAVRPTSIMGATKRVAELVIQDLDRRYSTCYLGVRFGNVLGSTGSVVPIFREQIAAGGPVTVTHRDVTRYFMTVAEAAQLVLQAAAIGEGGEIMTLDMGEPVRVADLARDMIRLSGLEPYVDIDIIFTGLRPGEKLIEDLELTGENMQSTRHPKIFIGLLEGYPPAEIELALARLEELIQLGDPEAVRRCLHELLPESNLKVGRRTSASSGNDEYHSRS